jgi:hypothetical protein
MLLVIAGGCAHADPERRAARGTPWVVRHGMTAEAYQQNFDQLGKEGYILTDVVGYDRSGQAAYAAIWERAPGPRYEARHGLTSAQYQSFFDEMVKKGYRPVHVSGYEVQGQDYYAAIFDKGSGEFISRHGMSSAEYQRAFDEYRAAGYTLVEVSGYELKGQPRFVAIWDKLARVPAYEARHDMTPEVYEQTFQDLAAKGFVLRTVTVYRSGNQPRYAAIWFRTGSAPWQARHGMSAAGWQQAVDELWPQGFIPSRLSVAEVGGRDVFAAIWVKR